MILASSAKTEVSPKPAVTPKPSKPTARKFRDEQLENKELKKQLAQLQAKFDKVNTETPETNDKEQKQKSDKKKKGEKHEKKESPVINENELSLKDAERESPKQEDEFKEFPKDQTEVQSHKTTSPEKQHAANGEMKQDISKIALLKNDNKEENQNQNNANEVNVDPISSVKVEKVTDNSNEISESERHAEQMMLKYINKERLEKVRQHDEKSLSKLKTHVIDKKKKIPVTEKITLGKSAATETPKVKEIKTTTDNKLSSAQKKVKKEKKKQDTLKKYSKTAIAEWKPEKTETNGDKDERQVQPNETLKSTLTEDASFMHVSATNVEETSNSDGGKDVDRTKSIIVSATSDPLVRQEKTEDESAQAVSLIVSNDFTSIGDNDDDDLAKNKKKKEKKEKSKESVKENKKTPKAASNNNNNIDSTTSNCNSNSQKKERKKMPKLVKPKLPKVPKGDASKTDDTKDMPNLVKPKFKAPKKKSTGFQAPTKSKSSKASTAPLFGTKRPKETDAVVPTGQDNITSDEEPPTKKSAFNLG